MVAYLLRRLAVSLLLLLLLLSLLFFLLHLAPGDPTTLLASPEAPRAEREQLIRVYGLDRPLPEQYLSWISAVLFSWDWGTSFVQGRPVTRMIAEALPNTLLLAVSASAVDYGVGLLLGVLAAVRRQRLTDHVIRVLSLLLFSLPVFWLALMAILLFSYLVPVLPAGHMASPGADDLAPLARLGDLAWHLLLPALVLGLTATGGTVRVMRNSMLEVLEQDYMRTARAKGLTERRVLLVHGLRNAIVPLVQLFGLSFPLLLNGALVIEVVFSWPGLGRMTFEAIQSSDYPVVLATTALSGALVLAGNLLADLLHAAVDPRVRLAGVEG
jgi:peptide/nickel transport system permease protein